MRAVILFLIFFHHLPGMGHSKSFNLESAILNPELLPGKFIFYADGYEDQRFDVDHDGSIDFWRLKQEDLLVDVSFKNSDVDKIFIRKISKNEVFEALYRKTGATLALNFAQSRGRFLMNFSQEDRCPDGAEPLKKELDEYRGFEELASNLVAQNLIDNSCKQKLGSGYNSLGSSLMKYLRGQDRISKCVMEPQFRQAFPPGKETDISFEVLRTAYSLERAKLVKDTEKYKPLISCEVIDERRGNQPGISTTEGGKITIAVSDSMPGQKISSAQLEHEFLHRIGLYSEASVERIVGTCDKINNRISNAELKTSTDVETGIMPSSLSVGKEAQAETIKAEDAKVAVPLAKPVSNVTGDKGGAETSFGATQPQQSEVYQSAVNAGSTTTANIPKTMTVAQTQVPSSESLSEAIYTNHQKTDSGISSAYAKSTAQSRGLLSMANNLAGAVSTPAEASLAKAKSQAREIAASSEVVGVKAGTNVAGASGLISRNKIGSDETIVESITLDTQKKAAASRSETVATVNQESRLPASEPRALSSAEVSASNLKVAAATTPVSESGVANINPIRDNPQASQGSGSGGNQKPQVSPRQGNVSNGTANSAGSPEELITYITQSNYSQTKQKLRDPNFTRQLETNGIQIIDLKGSYYGAKNGRIKFLDDEVKFVLQSK